MKLDPKDPDVWNKWRAGYETLTDDEQFEFVELCEQLYPEQKHSTNSNFEKVLCNEKNVRVLEIGGWKGELAHHCMTRFPGVAASWLNIDICQSAINKTMPMEDLPYVARKALKFDWFKEKRIDEFDVCISAHCIEHFSNEHLELLLAYIKGIPLVVFEAPLEMTKNDWTGYVGTHKLTMGWNAINSIMHSYGYKSKSLNEQCYVYRL